MKLPSVTVLICTLACALSISDAQQHETTPAKQWVDAPKVFLEKRWDAEKLKEVEAQWEEMRAQKMSSALFVVDSGFVVLQLGKVDQPVNCHSVRKSLLNSLFGVLHRKEKLKLSQTLGELKINDHTPLNAQEKRASINDLLKCRSGVYLPAEFETTSMKKNRPERGSHQPGEYYFYNNWDFNTLGGICRKLSGSDLFADFASEIADPIGMQDFDHRRDCRYWHDKVDAPKSQFPAYRFKMSARDRARFGLLYLQGGSWGERTILTEQWVTMSTNAYSTHRSDPDRLGAGQGYGLLWWVGDTGWLYGQKFKGQPYSARGNGGQFIAVIPSEDLVIAHANDTSVKGWKSSGKQRNKLMSLIKSAKKGTGK